MRMRSAFAELSRERLTWIDGAEGVVIAVCSARQGERARDEQRHRGAEPDHSQPRYRVEAEATLRERSDLRSAASSAPSRRLRKRSPEWESGVAGLGAPILCLCTTLDRTA